MRIFRALLVPSVALLLGGPLLAVPAQAEDLPVRTIEWTTTQKTYRAFQLKATISDMVDGKAVIQQKKCGKCKWKKFKKVNVNANGVAKTRILAPKEPGKWLYRVQVNGQDGFARSRSTKIGVIMPGGKKRR
ncbi:hypothetical protein [Nocardioides solisilvae]|uniref:hypothetical protein n=1 Tax=Nocardioides solisilvae TaxID=1542435 RepID=UPI000D749D60|nr:hypothetical protein [Nocardioides solisilvae]